MVLWLASPSAWAHGGGGAKLPEQAHFPIASPRQRTASFTDTVDFTQHHHLIIPGAGSQLLACETT